MSNAERRARKQENKRAAQEQRYARWASQRRRSRARRLAPFILLAFVAAVVLVFLMGDDTDEVATDTTTTSAVEAVEPRWDGKPCPGKDPRPETPKPQFTETPPVRIDEKAKYVATLQTSEGTMVAELDPAEDAVTVNNFVFLACQGFYDGVTFHRVIEGFMIQGGDPAGNGTGGPGYAFTGGKPESAYKVGDIVMANSGDPSSNGSQFFVVTGPQGEGLPLNYSRFGRLVEGVDVATKIAGLQDKENTDPQGGVAPPTRQVVIENVTVKVA